MARPVLPPPPLQDVGLFDPRVSMEYAEPTGPGRTILRGPATPASDFTSPGPGQSSARIEWPLVVTLRSRASAEITEQSERAATEGRPLSEQDQRLLGRAVIQRVVRAHVDQLSAEGAAVWSIDHEEAYAAAVESAIFGYGRLQPLFELDDVENIEIHGCDSVVIQRGDGSRHVHPPVADTDEELVEAVRFLGERNRPSRPFDDAHPTVTLALGERFRLHAIGFGLSYRPSVTIRRHNLVDIGLPDLVNAGMLPEQVGRYLYAAVRARKSIVVSGDQGAGKTTLLRALIAAIPDSERFGTIETDYELLTHLQPNRRNILALQARVGQGERQDGRPVGEVTVADLIPEALRQNLSRLVVGEVRGAEAAAMFESMQTGAGSLSTTHSHSSSATMDRLASRVAQGGTLGIDEAYRQIAHNIDLLVHVTLVDDTWRGGVRRRYVSEIRELTGAIESSRPVTHLTFLAEADGVNEPGFRPDSRTARELSRYLAGWRS